MSLRVVYAHCESNSVCSARVEEGIGMRRQYDYRDLDFRDIEILPPLTLTRRELLKLFGVGIIIFFSFDKIEAFGDADSEQEQRRREILRQQDAQDFNAFLTIGKDGKVTCFTGKIEMGQGIVTSLAQMLADELDVSMESVQMVMGDTDLCPWDMGTFGSLSTRYFGPTMRAAAAEARAVLMELGANILHVPLSRVKAEDGFIIERANPQNKVSYARIVRGKKIEKYLEQKPQLKNNSEFRIVGKPLPRRDASLKVTGKAQFTGDIRLPGMLYAKLLRPPAHGANIVEVDSSAAEKLEGITIIREDGYVAALHENPEEAEKAVKNIRTGFKIDESNVDDRTIFDHLINVAPRGQIVTQGGNIEKGRDLASEIFGETYLNSYVAHAP
jgi:isoquinoline 1-oxidoreductase